MRPEHLDAPIAAAQQPAVADANGRTAAVRPPGSRPLPCRPPPAQPREPGASVAPVVRPAAGLAARVLAATAGQTRAALVALAVLLLLIGTTFLVVGVRAQSQAPQPPVSAAGSYAAGLPSSSTKPGTRTAQPARNVAPNIVEAHGPILPRATPTHLTIPAIGVSSTLLGLGLNPDHTVQVPPLGADSEAGWYRYSPTPGQLGPAIILGHIDTARYGPGVFFKLGALRKGDSVSVRRSDGTVAVFRIDAVAAYKKNHFPTLTVYGNTDHAALRLITCGGKFDTSTKSYEENIVAFGTLTSSHNY